MEHPEHGHPWPNARVPQPSPVPFTCWRTLTTVKREHILGSLLQANGRASGPPTLLDHSYRRSLGKTGLGVCEQPGDVTEVA